MRIRKQYLNTYGAQKFQALNSGGTTFDLHLTTVWFGLIRRDSVVAMTVPDSADLRATLANWDRAVATRSPVCFGS